MLYIVVFAILSTKCTKFTLAAWNLREAGLPPCLKCKACTWHIRSALIWNTTRGFLKLTCKRKHEFSWTFLVALRCALLKYNIKQFSGRFHTRTKVRIKVHICKHLVQTVLVSHYNGLTDLTWQTNVILSYLNWLVWRRAGVWCQHIDNSLFCSLLALFSRPVVSSLFHPLGK